MKPIFSRALVIYYTIMSGHIFLAACIVFIVKPQPVSYSPFYLYGAVIYTCVVLAAAYVIYNKMIEPIKDYETDMQKLNRWNAVFIVKLALMESACIINLVFLFLTGSTYFIYLYVVAAVVMIINKPSVEKIKEQLVLSSSDF